MEEKELSTKDKVNIVGNCDEVTKAVKMLIGLMEESKLKEHVTFDYEIFGQKYQLNFKKL